MQKKVIALAIAGLASGVAFAQSNVTVYGAADVGYTYSKSDASSIAGGGDYKFSGMKDGVDNGINGSRVGFKGEEALGNGLKAIFLTEFRVNVNNGDQTQLTRQSYVGLSSAKMGTLTFGRQYSAAGDVYANSNSNSVVTIMPVNVFQGQGGSQIVSAGGNARQSNAIKYVSPTYSGFTGRVSYAFSNNANTTSAASAAVRDEAEYSDNGRWAASLDYTNGPLNVDVIIAKTSNAYTTNATTGFYGGGTPAGVTSTPFNNVDAQQGKDIDEWYVGGAYDFKVVKVYGGYQQMKNKNDRLIDITKSKMWQVGLSAPLGNGKLVAEYADIGFEQSNQVAALEQDGHNKGYGVGYIYDLSKRTSLYGFVSSLKYDSDTATTTGLANGIPAVGGASPGTAAAGERQTNVSVGLRHLF